MKIYFAFALASLNPIVSSESKVQDHSQGVLFFCVLFCLDGSGNSALQHRLPFPVEL